MVALSGSKTCTARNWSTWRGGSCSWGSLRIDVGTTCNNLCTSLYCAVSLVQRKNSWAYQGAPKMRKPPTSFMSYHVFSCPLWILMAHHGTPSNPHRWWSGAVIEIPLHHVTAIRALRPGISVATTLLPDPWRIQMSCLAFACHNGSPLNRCRSAALGASPVVIFTLKPLKPEHHHHRTKSTPSPSILTSAFSTSWYIIYIYIYILII
jgi:hypothetical protein